MNYGFFTSPERRVDSECKVHKVDRVGKVDKNLLDLVVSQAGTKVGSG
jgi:hypothetical protein